MILLVILALIVVCILLSFYGRQDDRPLRDIPLTATPEEWDDLEEDGEIIILNDRGSRTPTIQYKRYRDE